MSSSLAEYFGSNYQNVPHVHVDTGLIDYFYREVRLSTNILFMAEW